MVTSYDWESDTFTHHTQDNAARKDWRDAVATIADKAKATLPDCAGRVDRAVAIVLNHDVALLEDGKARVCSQSHGQVVYHVVNGACTCKDYEKAPSHWCKHRIAAGLYKRATALVQRKLHGASNGHTAPEPAPVQAETPAQEPAPTQVAQESAPAQAAPLPEAPVSITLKATLHGHEVLVTLRGTDFASVKVQVEAADAWLQAQAPAQPTTPADGWCSTHNVAMKLQHGKNGSGTWYSHKTAAGWCKG